MSSSVGSCSTTTTTFLSSSERASSARSSISVVEIMHAPQPVPLPATWGDGGAERREGSPTGNDIESERPPLRRPLERLGPVELERDVAQQHSEAAADADR